MCGRGGDMRRWHEPVRGRAAERHCSGVAHRQSPGMRGRAGSGPSGLSFGSWARSLWPQRRAVEVLLLSLTAAVLHGPCSLVAMPATPFLSCHFLPPATVFSSCCVFWDSASRATAGWVIGKCLKSRHWRQARAAVLAPRARYSSLLQPLLPWTASAGWSDLWTGGIPLQQHSHSGVKAACKEEVLLSLWLLARVQTRTPAPVAQVGQLKMFSPGNGYLLGLLST